MVRIGIVAPARRLTHAAADHVQALVAASGLPIELVIHPQCHLSFGHFAGSDEVRLAAFLSLANDPSLNAIWFARGGYGSARLLAGLSGQLTAHALTKVYLGYSDVGFLLAGLRHLGCRYCAHGPVVGDVLRAGGDATIQRALGFLARADTSGLEPHMRDGDAHLAYNLTTVCALLATDWLPETPSAQQGHILCLEDVAEYDYATDRRMFQLTSSAWFRNIIGVRIGRFSMVPDNDVPFPMTSEQAITEWCAKVHVPILGRADIGHDADNKIVPFGDLAQWRMAGLLPS